MAEVLLELGQDPRLMVWRNNTGRLEAVKKGRGRGFCEACGKALQGRWVSFGLPGSPDIIGFLEDGTWLGIEVKRPGQKQTDQQVKFQRRANQLQAVYLLTSSASHARERVNAILETGQATSEGGPAALTSL